MKRILITGGSRGIGAACVRAFSDGENKVAFIYGSSDRLAAEMQNEYNAIPIKADLSDINEIKNAATWATNALGGIDILVNNAGVSNIGLFNDLSDDDWQRLLNINLSSTVLLTRELSKHMISQHYGRIINVGSVWGRCGASCEVAYSATKSALRGFTMALAKELGPSGITVNCVEPGVIKTQMNDCFDEDTIEQLKEETPVCRLGEPYEVAELIRFLASDKAAFITGQCIGIDGGFGL